MTRPIEYPNRPMTHDQAASTHAAERYLLEELPELERHAFEEHFFSCADCAEDVRAGERMQAAVRDAGQGQPLAFQPRRDRRWTVALPWAAAASLALVAGYQSAVVPRFDRPFALEPVTLRPANRGPDVIVRLDSDDPAIALAIEAEPSEGAPEWIYEVRRSQGGAVAAGRTSVQARGMPLLLLVPASALREPGRYELSLRHHEGAPPVAEYQFAVVAP